MTKYLLQKSESVPYKWVLTDTEAEICCTFMEGRINDTQSFTPLRQPSDYNAAELPKIAAEMAEWLRHNHYEIIFSSPQRVAAAARAEIGRQIREAREAKGYTLRHLAKLTGIAYNHIARIECGKYNVTLDKVAVVADALGLKIELT